MEAVTSRYNELSEGQQQAINSLINHIAGNPSLYASNQSQVRFRSRDDGYKLRQILLKAYIR